MASSGDVEVTGGDDELGLMNEYRDLFFLEVKEHLATVNDSLLAYENTPEDKSHIDELFRSVHTIKSSSAMMGYDDLSTVSHQMEDIFDLARNGVSIPSEVIDLFFRVFDEIEAYIAKVEKGEEEKLDCAALVKEIQDYFTSNKPKVVEVTGDIEVKREDQGYSKFSSIESIRVKTDDLDKLLNLVGELVISKGQLNEVIVNKSTGVKHTLGTVDRISLELQDIVTKIRMVPAERVLNRFPRLVRDLSREQGKEIKLEMEGKEIELDRKILEEIGEPLIHLLRNAVDHGIEAPEVREACGKDRVGVSRIVAERNQENILIRVCDDGAGIDPQRIKEKALEVGLFSASELEGMNDRQLVNLIMVNGLTTSENVTSISGRGVGMNVVKTKIEKLGGSVVIESVLGEGTEFLLKLPLTLSILKAILIECADEVYAVPMNFIEDIETVERSIVQNLGHLEAVRVGGRTIRVVNLRRLLGVGTSDADVLHLLIIKNEGDRFGLVVDSVLGMREIMTKKLWDSLQRIRGVSGVTILGDGRVIIVLDPVSIYNDGLARGLA